MYHGQIAAAPHRQASLPAGPFAGGNKTGAGEPASNQPAGDTDVLTKARTRRTTPPQYRVILLNDDYTPMDFVIMILRRFFDLSPEDAHTVMLTVHLEGSAQAGIFSHEIAETKVTQVMQAARQNQHPLMCIMERQ